MAVKARYLITNEIAVASKPFNEGDFVKICMLKTAMIVCRDKHQAFANISLSRNTVADRISDLLMNLDCQLARTGYFKRLCQELTFWDQRPEYKSFHPSHISTV